MVDLVAIWAGIILFGVLMYVVMDGFDLGVGLLYPFVSGSHDRDIMMDSITPTWDGNETWLVFAGIMMFAIFPMAYAIILSALYIPIILMLFGLILRGVSLELRPKSSEQKKKVWDKVFLLGSLMATFSQGVVLGALLEGLPVSDRIFIGSDLDWFAPFPIFCGVGVMITYALLGCTWLIMKTEGALHERVHYLAKPILIMLLIVMIVVSVWTPFNHPDIMLRWFSLPNVFWFLPVPLLVVVSSIGLLKSIAHDDHYKPFLLSLLLVFLGYTGLGISLWPNIVPPSVSIWDAAAPVQTQITLILGAMFFIPIVLGYTAWSYYVFRGKVKRKQGY